MKVTWYLNNFKYGPYSRLKKHLGLREFNYNRHLTSVWNRCLQLIPYLEDKGIQCRVDSGNSLDTDVAILMRWHDDAAYDLVNQLNDRKVKTILDLCVNYFDETQSCHQHYGARMEQVHQAKRITPTVDLVICGSEYIRQKAAEFNKNSVYIPESVDYRHFTHRKSQHDFNQRTLRIIWSGQAVKAKEVADIYPLLEKKDTSLTIISDKKPNMPGIYEYLPWSYYTFPKSILLGDICISPRRIDNAYDLGHSHFKIGVFMGQGVPALASPLPSYKEIISTTNGGKICHSADEWATTLNEILEDRNTLWQWSQAAYDGIRNTYSTELVVDKYIKTFELLLAGLKQ